MSQSSAQPFDICVEGGRATKKTRVTSTSVVSTHRLKPGVILLKWFIAPKDQVEVVRTCRRLGICLGGFYQPNFGNGPKMRLWMMCLGKNWDPRSRLYGSTRPIDGAQAPAIPREFTHIVQAVISAATEVPQITPDICIVNFYDSTGRLGLHQDKDESKTSIN